MKINKIKRYAKPLVLLLAAMFLVSGCSFFAAEPTPTPVPPTETPVPPTETPVPPTETPEPTATNTPTETPTLTPTETPTATPDLAATAAFEATQAAEAALEMVNAELTKIGLSSDGGYLAWADEGPFDVVSNSPGSIVYEPIDEGTIYETYILSTEVTWESTTGLAGCGIIFHSETNLTMGRQYQFFTLRLSGLPAWDVELWEYGYWQSTTTGEMKVNSAIDLDDGATNHYIMHVQDGLVTFYANGQRLSNVIISSRDEGRIAYYTWQESGTTTCSFENNWIWAFDE